MTTLYHEDVLLYLLFLSLRTQVEQLYRDYNPPMLVVAVPPIIAEPRKEKK